MWVNAARHYRCVPQDTVGLRAVAAKLRARKKKVVKDEDTAEKKPTNDVHKSEGDIKKEEGQEQQMETDEVKQDDAKDIELKTETTVAPTSGDVEIKEENVGTKEEAMELKEETEVKQEEPMETNQPLNEATSEGASVSVKNESVTKEEKSENVDPSKSKEEPMEAKEEQEEEEEEIELLDITEALLTRKHFPKVTKPYSRLDQLLERRQKQWELEQKQKMAILAVVNRYKMQEAEKKMSSVQKQTKSDEDVDVVGDKPEEKTEMKIDDLPNSNMDESNEPSFCCYSAGCRKKGQLKMCYSPTCKYSASRSEEESDGEDDEETTVDVESKDDKEDKEDKESKNGEEEGEKSKEKGQGDADKTPQENGMETDPPKPGGGSSSAKTTAAAGSKVAAKPPAKKALVAAKPEPKKPAVPAPKASSTMGQTIASIIQGGKIQLTPSTVPELEAKLENVGKTQFQASLVRTGRGGRGVKGKASMKKGNIPCVTKFIAKSSGKRSIFTLEKLAARKLARRSGRWEVDGFNYNCKMNNVNWPYPCPRPAFKTCWRYRTQTLKTLSAAALQLRVLWACLRWDDLSIKPPAGGTNTITTETDITTTEVLKRRDVGPYSLRSEYLVRKIIVPIGVPQQPRGKIIFPF